MNDLLPDDYPGLLREIKERIRKARYEALKAVNTELIALYRDIGRMLVERQQGDTWGKAVAEQLAKDLQAEFPGMSGFSRRNIFYMREFYLCYRGQEKVQRLVAQIGWSHNLIIFQKCKDDPPRHFSRIAFRVLNCYGEGTTRIGAYENVVSVCRVCSHPDPIA